MGGELALVRSTIGIGTEFEVRIAVKPAEKSAARPFELSGGFYVDMVQEGSRLSVESLMSRWGSRMVATPEEARFFH